MTTKDFIRKWGVSVKGAWWLKNADRCYWAASYGMPWSELLKMSQDFMALSNLDTYRGTPSCMKAMFIASGLGDSFLYATIDVESTDD